MNIYKKLIPSFSVILATFVFAISPVSAQQSSGVTISPLIFELNADPGDVSTNQVKLYNPTDLPMDIEMKMEDFRPLGEEGQVALTDGSDDNSTFSVASWTTFTPSKLTLAPKESKFVTFSMQIPANAEPGGHYGSVLAFISGATNQVSGSSISTKTGSLVFIRISGNIREAMGVEEFSTAGWQDYAPIDFNVRFRNDGNVHVKPAGFITITDTFGNQVGQIEIPVNNVLPDSIRRHSVPWETSNLFGRYTATLVANYGSVEKETVTNTITFTVIPLKEVLAVLLTITIASSVLYSGRKRIGKAIKVILSGEQK